MQNIFFLFVSAAIVLEIVDEIKIATPKNILHRQWR